MSRYCRKERNLKRKTTIKNKIPGLYDICGKVFRTKALASSHRIVHLGNENKEYMYACQICNKAFPRKNALDRHVFIHSELKNFACELCSLAFKSNNNLRHHCAVHHENRHYKCKYCYRRFRSSDGRKFHYLKEHNDQIESLGFKLYPCTYCDHVSATYQLSVQHLSIHVDNKVLVCSICQRRYATVADLNKHRRKSYFNKKKLYRCNICDFSFLFKHKLEMHLSSNKHKKNCRTAGFYLDSVITDMNNKNIIEISENGRKEY